MIREVSYRTVHRSEIINPALRLDASFYRSSFIDACDRLKRSGWALSPLSEFASAHIPSRVKLVTTTNSRAGAPYLRAHGVFDLRPKSKRYIARSRVSEYDSLLLAEGMILTPSSGRNLGPVAYVGSYLKQFALTDIMRICPHSKEAGYYLYAYLLTPTAQALIKRGRSGTTVDHLSPTDLLGLLVPEIDAAQRRGIVDSIAKAEADLDAGRLGLDRAGAKLQDSLGLDPARLPKPNLSESRGRAFSVTMKDLTLRLDAAFYDPAAVAARAFIKGRGGIQLSSVARLQTLPRYVRYYVNPPYGRPVLSGRQMLQVRPVNLRRISDRSFKNSEDFKLTAESTIFTCDGRSEDALGEPAYVLKMWDGWLASEHVMRVHSTGSLGRGYLYLALACDWVQLQLKSRATGSVIDALEPEEIADVYLPLVPEPLLTELDCEVKRCWDLISNSMQNLQSTTNDFERILRRNESV